jgi:hypothetical protein
MPLRKKILHLFYRLVYQSIKSKNQKKELQMSNTKKLSEQLKDFFNSKEIKPVTDLVKKGLSAADTFAGKFLGDARSSIKELLEKGLKELEAAEAKLKQKAKDKAKEKVKSAIEKKVDQLKKEALDLLAKAGTVTKETAEKVSSEISSEASKLAKRINQAIDEAEVEIKKATDDVKPQDKKPDAPADVKPEGDSNGDDVKKTMGPKPTA